jgi:uncharacterized membrane protein YidH (DUF202 family)
MTVDRNGTEQVEVYGAARERTALAWQRTGLGVVIGYFLLFVALVRHGVLAFGALAAGVAVTLTVLAATFLPTARRPRREEPDAWVLLLGVAVPVLTLAVLGALVAVIPLLDR